DVELGSPIEEAEDARGRRDAPTVEVDDPPFRSPMVAELVAHLRLGEPCERVGVEAAEDLRNDAPVPVLGERQIGEEELILAHRQSLELLVVEPVRGADQLEQQDRTTV